MRMKILASALLLALGSAANAATVYVLDSTTYVNSFFSTPVPTGACYGCGTATATVDGTNVTFTTAGWAVSGSGVSYEITFAGTTTVGAGVSLTKAPGDTCTDISGAACDPVASNKSGFGGDTFLTGLAFDGTTVCTFCAVNVSADGSTLSIKIQRQLQESGFGASASQTIALNYSAVPVPAAVWMFGSALGLMGFARRRALKA